MRAPARPGRMAPFRRGQKKDIPLMDECFFIIGIGKM